MKHFWLIIGTIIVFLIFVTIIIAFRKKFNNSIFASIKRHPIRHGLFLVVIGIVIQLFIQLLYWIGETKGIPTNFYASDTLIFWGSYLSFIGTLGLGILALWQNNGLMKINQRLLEIEEASLFPIIDFSKIETENHSKYKKSIETENFMLFTVDGKECKFDKNNGITNSHNDLTVVLEIENASNVRIIGIDLYQICFSGNIAFMGLKNQLTNKIKNIGNAFLKPNESKPIIISGLEDYYSISPHDDPPILALIMWFHLTNAVGQIYDSEITLFIRSDSFQNKVLWPSIDRKFFKTPQKI